MLSATLPNPPRTVGLGQRIPEPKRGPWSQRAEGLADQMLGTIAATGRTLSLGGINVAQPGAAKTAMVDARKRQTQAPQPTPFGAAADLAFSRS